MKTNNKGFSYVEMIVVIAIMSLMVGMIAISIGTVNRNKVNRAAESLETMVDKARVSAMTKGAKNGFLNIAKIDNAVYAAVGEQMFTADDVKMKGEKICSGKVYIDFRSPNNPVNLGAGFHDDYSSESSSGVYSIGFKQVSGGPVDGVIHNVIVRDGSKADDGTIPSGVKSIGFNIERFSGSVSK